MTNTARTIEDRLAAIEDRLAIYTPRQLLTNGLASVLHDRQVTAT
jgi:hypothetical protein